jgi:hypothetical protein
MKLRSLIITVAVLAALSVAAYLGNRPEAAPPADPRVGTALLGPDVVARAAGIVIEDQGKKVELARNPDASWRVPSYFDMPADIEKVARLIQDLNEAKVDRFVTSSPDRLSHLEFKDSKITLTDPAGKEIWSLTLGKTAESGNGRFIRFGSEPRAFFSGMHVWLDTDAKGWANAQLVSVKPRSRSPSTPARRSWRPARRRTRPGRPTRPRGRGWPPTRCRPSSRRSRRSGSATLRTRRTRRRSPPRRTCAPSG